MTMKIKLTVKSSYGAKDQAKSDRCNKFIGRGSSASSTAQYAKDWGAWANSGRYEANDIVFVSAEGNRSGRLAPDFDELILAVKAGVRFVTDSAYDRNRSYNIGEREVESFLKSQGYREVCPGGWRKV